MGYSVQKVNQQLRMLLEPFFLRRREFYESGIQLENALFSMHLGGVNSGPGKLKYAWRATNNIMHCSDVGVAPMTENNFHDEDLMWEENSYWGGPYVRLDGVDTYLSVADAVWQEPTNCDFMVWCWCLSYDDTRTQYLISKWDYGSAPTRMAYCLRWNLATTAFEFSRTTDGTAGTQGTAVSTYGAINVTDGIYYFVGGCFCCGDDIKVYVASAQDNDLTIDWQAAIPAGNTYDGNEPLLIGAAYNNGAATDFWYEDIGILQMRIVPFGFNSSDEAMRRIFQMTKWFYRTPW